MSGYDFSLTPKYVPSVETRFRRIKTRIPVPESIKVFEDLAKYESRSMHGQLPVVWNHAEDFQVFDRYGNCWIDFTSTIFLTNVGHTNPNVVAALKNQIDQKLLHTYTFAHEIRSLFMKKLIEITPEPFEMAFLLSSGTEATECAFKLTRMHGQIINPSKLGIISFRDSMHGRTMGAEMLKGNPISSAWIGYMDPNIYHLPFPYPWLIEGQSNSDYDGAEHFGKDIETLRKNGLDFNDISGFMIESYLGWGAIFYPKTYIQALAAFAKEHNALITFDDIQGGFGRTGKLFAYQHYDVEPDLVCLGKALSGSLPLSAVIGRREIMNLPEAGSMSSTHSGNPLCCAAGLATLETIQSQNLVAESARKGKILHQRLDKLKDKYSHCISYVLGKGLIAGIITVNSKTSEPDGLIASRVCEKAMQKGLLVVHTGREAIKIGPPLTIPDEALLEGIEVLDESFQEVINEEG